MNLNLALEAFMAGIYEDPRVRASHVSLFMALLIDYKRQNGTNPMTISQENILNQAKISYSTFHRCIHDLNDFGYVRYLPSFNPLQKSRVLFPATN